MNYNNNIIQVLNKLYYIYILYTSIRIYLCMNAILLHCLKLNIICQ